MYFFQELAEELKQARLNKAITLEQISSRTKIDLKFLEAMESGDFSFLPDIYVKAFVKQYSSALDLDEDKIIEKYEAAKSGSDPAKNENTTEKIQPANQPPTYKPQINDHLYDAVGSGSSNPKAQKNFTINRAIFSIIFGVLAVLAIIYFVFLRSSKEIIVSEKPIQQIIHENESRYKVNTPPKDTSTKSVIAEKSDSLSLTIHASDTSWVKIVLDDNATQDFIMFPNSQKVLNAKDNFKITLGNSGGISLRLNNKKLDFEGIKGKIKYISVDKSGLKYLKIP